jgi:hypothetical protein
MNHVPTPPRPTITAARRRRGGSPRTRRVALVDTAIHMRRSEEALARREIRPPG